MRRRNEKKPRRTRYLCHVEQLEARWAFAGIAFAIRDTGIEIYSNQSVVFEDVDRDGSVDINVGGDSEFADLDGDGDLDSLDIGSRDKPVWFEFESGMIPREHEFTVVRDGIISSVETGDLDRDGDTDVLAIVDPSNGIEPRLIWLENMDHRGSLVAKDVDITYGFRSRLLSTDDFDGDGDLDVLLTGLTGYARAGIAWIENRDGGFASVQLNVVDDSLPAGVALSSQSATVGDVDRDGDSDLALIAVHCSPSCRGPSRFIFFENTDGRGAFRRKLQIETSDIGLAQLQLTDVEGDGDLDLVSLGTQIEQANYFDPRGRLMWFANTDGRWNYGPPQLIAGISPPRAENVLSSSWSWAVDDMDADGDADFLVPQLVDETTGRLVIVETRLIADVNDDHVCDSRDLIAIFQAGEYEDGHMGNSTFDEGDWNGDGEFDSSDLVIAFQAGSYKFDAIASTKEKPTGRKQ